MSKIQGQGPFSGNPDPATLADRLHEFAKVTGVAYRVSSQATGLALIDHTRPPRRNAAEPTGRGLPAGGPQRGAAAAAVPARPPRRPVYQHRDRLHLVAAVAGIRRVVAGGLLASETVLPYAHGYDRGASHLGGWHVEFGVEGGRHHVGPDAAWNGKTSQAGLWLISRWDWADWGLPDPASALNARVEGDRVWVTTPTLSQLKLHGITPDIHEAWIWAKSSRYLDLAAKIIADARTPPRR